MAEQVKNSIECWVFDENQQCFLLLQCPENKSHKSYWQPVTGGIEDGEDALDASLREVLEETGIRFEKGDLVKLIDRFRVYKDETQLNKTVFLVKTSDLKVVISDEHIDYQWASPDKVPGLLLWGSNIRTFQTVTEYISQTC